MIYFCSDLHLNHQNILKYESVSRPFNTVEEMNEALIKNWNARVREDDLVYVLGDLAMGKLDGIRPLVERLNGKIILVRGNHDTEKRCALYREMGIEIHDIAYLTYKGRFFIMCHFPIASKEFVDMVRNDNSEVVCLFGHVHHNAPRGYHDGTFHVGVDTNDLTPLSIEEIWQQCWPEEVMRQPAAKEYYNNHKNDCN